MILFFNGLCFHMKPFVVFSKHANMDALEDLFSPCNMHPEVPRVNGPCSKKIKADPWYIWIKYISLSTLLLFLHVYGGVYSLSFRADSPFEGRRRKRRGGVLVWVLQVFLNHLCLKLLLQYSAT